MSALFGMLMGAVAGLLIGLFGIFFVLPAVLKIQRKALSDDYRVPVFGWNRDEMGRATTLAYRFALPLMFVVLGGITGYQFSGAGH